jgi:ribonuclease HI
MGVGVWVEQTNHSISIPAGPGTNQVAELLALLRAIQISSKGDVIFSDSRYAIGMAGHWRARANLEVVARLRQDVQGKDVNISWVRGHNGNKGNMMADRLAGQAAIPTTTTVEEFLRVYQCNP